MKGPVSHVSRYKSVSLKNCKVLLGGLLWMGCTPAHSLDIEKIIGLLKKLTFKMDMLILSIEIQLDIHELLRTD